LYIVLFICQLFAFLKLRTPYHKSRSNIVMRAGYMCNKLMLFSVRNVWYPKYPSITVT